MQSREHLETYSSISRIEAEAYLDIAVGQVRNDLKDFTSQFPDSNSRNGIYPGTENVEWTTGFWTGEVWLSYERTGEK